MAVVASTVSGWQAVRATTTVRQFGRAITVALLAIGTGCAIYAVETLLLRPEREFLESPTDVMMRALGLAHFCVGWLFLFTSPRVRNLRALAWLPALTVGGAALCLAFASCDGLRNPVVLLLFYGYFLAHEIRDETALYQAYGDAPSGSAAERRFLGLLGWAVCLLAVAALVTAFSLHGNAVEKAARYTDAPGLMLFTGIALPLGGGLWLAALALRAGRQQYGTARLALAAHRPLLTVYGVILLVLLLGSLAGSAGFDLIILIHVSAWLVFIHHQLGRRPRSEVGGVWAWLRWTPAGFVTLHLAVAGAVLVLMAVRVHVWQRGGWVSEALATSSFPYWSLMHISMTLWRPR
ncbi:MAG: hypothetical protein IT429_19570 [Gemmataceae bacterium]|nr:hypothetical protein [Gemmataceae bacterium]